MKNVGVTIGADGDPRRSGKISTRPIGYGHFGSGQFSKLIHKIDYRIGIDLGTNSIGWCVLDLNDNNETTSSRDIGVRIFPEHASTGTRDSFRNWRIELGLDTQEGLVLTSNPIAGHRLELMNGRQIIQTANGEMRGQYFSYYA